jgi:DNA polymerase III gamma/tau subunit
MSLYAKYRPTLLKHIVGQESAVAILKGFMSNNGLPRAILFHGPSGCGKTTLARILRKKLNCSDFDFMEQNAASSRGIDTIRDIETKMRLSPMNGDARVFLIDECHRLTNDAQSALLKMLEDTPSHAYFMLATTDPQKLLSTIRTRCTDIAVKQVEADDMEKLIRHVWKKEKLKISDEVIDKIVDTAEGSPRKALVLLDSVANVPKDEQLAAIENADEKKQAIDLCRMLMGHDGRKMQWSDAATIIKNIPENDIESFRRMVLSYANSCLIGAKERKPPKTMNRRAYMVIVAFRDNFFDSGRAGLTAACIEALKN